MANSNKFKSKVDRLKEKRDKLTGNLNKAIYDLGVVRAGALASEEQERKLAASIKDLIKEIESVNQQLASLLKNVPQEPPIPEVGLTEDAKREMTEALKLQGDTNEVNTVFAPSPNEAPVA